MKTLHLLLLISGLLSVFVKALSAMSFPLSTAFIVFHKFGCWQSPWYSSCQVQMYTKNSSCFRRQLPFLWQCGWSL
ncbi:beta-defensin 50 isoform X2 [Rattus norvegicus]|uniref:beta-defensin 50 isoform X2 n=1 Tax=Rattus norvegicus TaxID=10116 RepID=UPI002FD80029